MLCDDTACPKFFDEDAECQQELDDCTEYPRNRELEKNRELKEKGG